MTKEQALERIKEISGKRQRAYEGLVEPTKSAVLALRDAKLENQARRLDEALYELELVNQAMTELMKEDSQAVLEALLAQMAGE